MCAFSATTQELFSQAESFSSRDMLEQAYDTYQEIINMDPTNIKARIEQAKIVVWQGRYREGIAILDPIVEANPKNIDALRELAYAYYWENMDLEALAAIYRIYAIDPANQGAKDLYDIIINAHRPYISQYNSHSYENIRNSIFTDGLKGGFSPDYRSRLELLYEHEYASNSRTDVGSSRYGIGSSRRFSDLLEVYSHLYWTYYDKYDFDPFTTNTWITIFPSDALRFDISYDRETFQDLGSTMNKIIVNNCSASFDLKPDRFWLISGKIRNGSYTDDNGQLSYLGKVEYRLFLYPYTKLYYNYYSSEWKEQLASGYFNPYSLVSHMIGISSDFDISKALVLKCSFAAGLEHQNPISEHPIYSSSLGLLYRFTDNWVASLKGTYFNANSDPLNADYMRNTVTFDMTYQMGKPEILLHGTSHFSRPDI